jgi:hypothetical protein
MVHVLLTLNEPLLQRSRPRGPLGLSLTTILTVEQISNIVALFPIFCRSSIFQIILLGTTNMLE